VVCDFFAGQILSKVVCGACGKESIAFDNIWDIDLNFTPSDNGDILRMVEHFLKEETISQDYYCSKCKGTPCPIQPSRSASANFTSTASPKS
jgi:ubiquitin C-terminal hydrolase